MIKILKRFGGPKLDLWAVELNFKKDGKGKFTRQVDGSLQTRLTLEEAENLMLDLAFSLYGSGACVTKPCTLSQTARENSRAGAVPVLESTRLGY